MKKPIKLTILMVAFLTSPTLLSCGKTNDPKGGETMPELTFESHHDGVTVSRSLPLAMKGKIRNFSSLDEKTRKGLHLYLMEQSTTEKIWHIEPETRLDNEGNWRGITWLGNPRQGNGETFTVCITALSKKLKLRNGDHPVAKKPSGLAESCISIKRQDR